MIYIYIYIYSMPIRINVIITVQICFLLVTTMLFSTPLQSWWKGHCNIGYILGYLEYTLEFAVLSYQYWLDMFYIPCFLHSPRRCSWVLQDQQESRAGDVCKMSNGSAWEPCLENLDWNLVLCEQLLQTWLCMIIGSMASSLSKQAGFQI